MAKVKPAFTLIEMEDDMRYKVGASSRPDAAKKRFYSDLRRVPDDTYGLTEKNYQEFVKRKHDNDGGRIAAGLLPGAGQSEASISVWCDIGSHLIMAADYRECGEKDHPHT